MQENNSGKQFTIILHSGLFGYTVWSACMPNASLNNSITVSLGRRGGYPDACLALCLRSSISMQTQITTTMPEVFYVC